MKSISSKFDKKKITTLLFIIFTINTMLRAEEPKDYQKISIFDLQPFDRAVCCIKFYEGMHRAEHYPYVGYGHKLKPGEDYTSEMTRTEAEILLRKDLRKFCSMFRSYGKDSLLLATLAYNVGPYTLLGSKSNGIEKSKLLYKLETGDREIEYDYLKYCHWNGKYIPSMAKRRYFELLLLYSR